MASTKSLGAVLAGIVLAFGLALTSTLFAGTAYASDPEILLGCFTRSAADGSDVLMVSSDGVNFTEIATVFPDATPTDTDSCRVDDGYTARTYNIWAHQCPSIMYYNGYFWMLSNEGTSTDGKMHLIMSNSKDLVNWCDPTGFYVSLEGSPKATNGSSNSYDLVAADWAVSPEGKIYIVVSIGYYGDFHGDAENDTMYPYLIEVTSLKASNDPAVNRMSNIAWGTISITTSKARYIDLPISSTNRIDGSLYFEGNAAYLSIKRDGVTNEIFSIPTSKLYSSCGNSSSWTTVNSDVSTGFEAPCLTKYNNRYYMYVDRIASYDFGDIYGRNGTNVLSTSNLFSSWSSPQLLMAKNSDGKVTTVSQNDNEDFDGPRHGTVINVSDPDAVAIIAKAMGVTNPKTDGTAKEGNVYRLYNKATSEHLYTTSATEYYQLALLHGWTQEGVSWTCPTSSEVGVYRLYNEGLSVHHYTSNTTEADTLVAEHGWKYDNGGKPIFYSASTLVDGKQVAMDGAKAAYRLYNDGLSQHLYTLSASESNTLVTSFGWASEGVGFYAFKAS